MGGQVGTVGHISIAKGSQIAAKTGINRNLEEEGKKWGGMPVTTFNENYRSQVVFQRLPELERKLEALEKQLKTLVNRDDL